MKKEKREFILLRESIKRYNQGEALFVCGNKRMQISIIATEAELDSFGSKGGL